jgi:hypothetical protein
MGQLKVQRGSAWMRDGTKELLREDDYDSISCTADKFAFSYQRSIVVMHDSLYAQLSIIKDTSYFEGAMILGMMLTVYPLIGLCNNNDNVKIHISVNY